MTNWRQIFSYLEDSIRILRVSKFVSKGYLPCVTIYFTPVTVYSHSNVYEELQKDVRSIVKPYKSYVMDVDTLRKPPHFKDRGMTFNFKVDTSEDVLNRVVDALSSLIGKRYKEND
jgi:hypothetical protein